jgi:hypothetical protein
VPVTVDIKPKVNALVDGKARHQPVLVVDMRAQWAYPIGRENMVLMVIHSLVE